MNKSNNRGFTLIELLVIIAIVGVLSSIIIGSVSLARKKGKEAAVRAGMREFMTQGQLYLSDYGSFAAASSSVRSGCFNNSSNFLSNTLFGDTSPKQMIEEINKQGAPLYCAISASGNIFSLLARVTDDKNLCLDSEGGRIESANIDNSSALCTTPASGSVTNVIFSNGLLKVRTIPNSITIPPGGQIAFNNGSSHTFTYTCSPGNVPSFTLSTSSATFLTTPSGPGTLSCTGTANPINACVTNFVDNTVTCVLRGITADPFTLIIQ